MFGFEYKYKTTAEILDATKRVIEFSPIEYAILAWVVIWLIGGILYVFPLLMTIEIKRRKEKGKRKRKKLLSQISMQKEIEDEIAAEIEATNQ